MERHSISKRPKSSSARQSRSARPAISDRGTRNALVPVAREPGTFYRLAQGGFGDGLNSYAHTMAWFNGHIYVGTSRCTLHMVKVNDPPPALTYWPVKTPKNVYDLDRRAHIWRYDPKTSEWTQVYTSPMIKGRTGEIVARDIGYRGSVVYQGPQDPAPALYVCTWSSSKGRPPLVMRSYDGINFEDLPPPKWDDPTVNTFRTLVPFKGRLFTTPTGRTTGYGKAQECVSHLPTVFESPDIASGIWRVASPPAFGDTDNVSIFEMQPFNGYLYAGTLNPISGFQLWKTRANGKPPYRWKKVISEGAFRGNVNEIAVSMCPFKGALYVGTGIVNGGYDRTYKIGPAAAEIIRVHPDDSWDLLVGEPRQTPQGFKFPLSGMKAGFGNIFNGYVWRLVVHEGRLYAGTFKWNVLLPYFPLEKWPEQVRSGIRMIGVDNIVQDDGGFDIWETADGSTWNPVTTTGFENPYNWGVRTMASTPYGVFIGTANPFGPKVAIRNAHRWRYRKNPRGGLEVWLGGRKDDEQAHPPSPTGAPGSLTALRGQRGDDDPLIPKVSLVYDETKYDPFIERYYEQSGYRNLGYWEHDTTTQRIACEILIEKLLSFLPPTRGTILDVAWASGATTKYLLNHYHPSSVVGIYVSGGRMSRRAKRGEGYAFLSMKPTHLEFEDNFFDAVLCVESAFRFNLRNTFLREAFRVLKPGGHLIASDILLSRLGNKTRSLPQDNYVGSIGEYQQCYDQIGFQHVNIVEATEECSKGHHRHFLQYARDRFQLRRMKESRFDQIQRDIFMSVMSIRHYVLVSAQKPSSE